jgi:HAD superfamily hydrolase (TIGR01509 family)
MSNATNLKALIFDVDGTLADTETAHLAAFNYAFKELGMDWHWDVPTYTDLLSISGGRERILHYWKLQQPGLIDVGGGSGVQDTVLRIHEIKTSAYESAVNEDLVQMRPGVLALLTTAHAQGLSLAIATTTSPVNIAALLRKAIGLDWRTYFSVIEDASTAEKKKPHPQVYLQTLSRMGIGAHECLAFEDSENGLRAARGAGLATIVTPNNFTKAHDFTGATRVLPSLSGVGMTQLTAWHRNI